MSLTIQYNAAYSICQRLRERTSHRRHWTKHTRLHARRIIIVCGPVSGARTLANVGRDWHSGLNGDVFCDRLVAYPQVPGLPRESMGNMSGNQRYVPPDNTICNWNVHSVEMQIRRRFERQSCCRWHHTVGQPSNEMSRKYYFTFSFNSALCKWTVNSFTGNYILCDTRRITA